LNIEFIVSVIIPVYNREEFIRKSVESANCLNEVGEILIIDDGSSDNSIEIAKNLVKEFPKVKLLQHPDKKNHGVSASRNLGIMHAKYDFIAFLDSDDYYLPNRFTEEKEIFEGDITIDGVYNAVGVKYYTTKGELLFEQTGYKYQEFLSFNKPVPPEHLFCTLFNNSSEYTGEFHGNGITVKKTLLKKTGLFNTELKQKEDIHLWRRMAAVGKLVAGNIKTVVSIRGIHDYNTMTNLNIQPEADEIWWRDLNKWFKRNKISKDKMECFRLKHLYYKIHNCIKATAIIHFLLFFISKPKYIMAQYGYFDIYFFDLFGRTKFFLMFISLKNKIIKRYNLFHNQ
jgi:glycosyltransferase involved in cell wall biosynthesis